MPVGMRASAVPPGKRNGIQAMAAYAAAHPQLAAQLQRRLAGELPADFSEQAAAYIARCQQEGKSIASRKASENCLNAFGPLLPELLGGSADLAGSNLTLWSGSKGVSAADASGNYIYYGVREFAMAAIMNGIALHGGFINYGATFLIFMEYARNAVRMSALMRQQSIFVFTHDSIGLGEDGPTHQPVEQLTALRATPNMQTWRPCDAVESAVAWKAAIERRDGPSSLVFSRQTLAHQPRSEQQVADIIRGAYVLSDCAGSPDAILIATGSEVQLAVAAAQQLAASGQTGARCFDALCRVIRTAGRGLSRSCIAQRCAGPRGGRGTARGLLVQVGWPGRARGRYDHLWRVRPGRTS